MDYYEISASIRYLIIVLLFIYESFKFAKEHKKNKQLEADYNELLKQVVALTNENAELKKERVQI